MKKDIGLTGPMTSLILFGLLYQPWVAQKIPKEGILAWMLTPQVFLLICSSAIILPRKLSWSDFGLRYDRLKADLVLGLILGLMPVLLTLFLAALFLPLSIWNLSDAPIPMNGARLWVLLFLAPVAEEIFFRGLVLQSLRERFSATFSIVISATFFMCAHGGFHLGPLLLGLITAPVVLLTGSIWPGMIFHAISNSYGPILMKYFPELFASLEFLFR